MTTRTVKQAVCDRCGSVIASEDEEGGQLDLNTMTDDWHPVGVGSCLVIGDLCGVCVRSLKAWMQSGGAKPSHHQPS